MNRTRVIALEGIDGSGKSVQFERLRDALVARGFSVATRAYPVYEGSFFGAQVGRYLTGSEGVRADSVDGKSMALWFALDRWEDLQQYRDGEADYLLINRYILSNAVYQSVRDIDLGRPDLVDWVFELEYEHFHLPRVDVHLFYDVDLGAAEQNMQKKGFRGYVGEGKDVYEASDSLQARVRMKYLECAQRRDDIAVVPCMQQGMLLSMERVSQLTLDALKARGMLD